MNSLCLRCGTVLVRARNIGDYCPNPRCQDGSASVSHVPSPDERQHAMLLELRRLCAAASPTPDGQYVVMPIAAFRDLVQALEQLHASD